MKAGGTLMQDPKPHADVRIIEKIGRAMPKIYIIALLVMSMISNPLFSSRPATDAKQHVVLLLMGVLGSLLHMFVIQQQQRIERLERRLAELTDIGGAP
jgi:hypothetical protein